MDVNQKYTSLLNEQIAKIGKNVDIWSSNPIIRK